MFEKFGEFDSFEEINMSAKGLKDEGDKENLYVLAAENGIDKAMVDMFLEGDIDFICDAETAALGKLSIEQEDVKAQEIMIDWVDYIKGCVAKEPQMAAAVRKKGKTLKGCVAELLVWSMKNAKPVDKDIIKMAKAHERTTLGIPGMATVKKIIREYYLGK